MIECTSNTRKNSTIERRSPDLKTELVKIDSLVFDPANARKHDEKNLGAIKSSLQRFGQQKPIVVDASGVVRAGNGTLAAAKALGWKEISIVRSPLSGSEATAYAIADNRSSELAEWDDDVLSQTLAALQIEDEDLALATGFDAKEIDALLAPDEVKEDEVPEAPVDPITKPGDLWLLGDHRLLCGDSTKSEDVERLMNGEKADLLLTDPPYGIGYQKNGASGTHGWTNYGKIEWDKERPSRETICSSMKKARSAIIWGGNYFADYLPPSMGFFIWDKGQRDFSLADCEMAWRSEQKAARIFSFSRAKALQDGKEHPTQKPVALFVWCIEQIEGAKTIFDPFLGSGTTLIAAEQLGRKCYGMEISPAYCDVIVKRWENLTGKKAARG
jgi:ParB-like chromosome segregation protein Spo0J